MRYKFKSKDKNKLSTGFTSSGSMDYILKDDWSVELELVYPSIESTTVIDKWSIYIEDLVPIEEPMKVGDMVSVSHSANSEDAIEIRELLAILPDDITYRYICRNNRVSEAAASWKYAKPIPVVEPTCDICDKELPAIVSGARYVEGSYCSAYCADVADLKMMMKEL